MSKQSLGTKMLSTTMMHLSVFLAVSFILPLALSLAMLTAWIVANPRSSLQ